MGLGAEGVNSVGRAECAFDVVIWSKGVIVFFRGVSDVEVLLEFFECLYHFCSKTALL